MDEKKFLAPLSSLAALQKGVQVIHGYIKTLPDSPGVYRMLNQRYEALYVGKARNLKKRVQSYTQIHRLPNRLKRMIAETSLMEFVTTHTEVEALLLEANLIKKLSPRYNILLKDSKFFSFIMVTDHAWPRLKKHRGAKDTAAKYYGPFASTEAVNHTLTTLYKVFRLRSCSDSFFTARKKPCLQYYIKRCTAPCVGYIIADEYADSVQQTINFLEGKSHQIQKDLSAKMLEASHVKNYEQAVGYRNMIRALTQIQTQQNINSPVLEDADIMSIASLGDVYVFKYFSLGGEVITGRTAFFLNARKTFLWKKRLLLLWRYFIRIIRRPVKSFLTFPRAMQSLWNRLLPNLQGIRCAYGFPKRARAARSSIMLLKMPGMLWRVIWLIRDLMSAC